MDNSNKTSQIMEVLQAAGLEISTETIEGIPVTVAKGVVSDKSDSTSEAMSTILAPFTKKKYELHFYIAIGAVEDLSVQTLEQFSDSTHKFSIAAAKADKKQKKLKFKGAVCIAILLSGNADNDAKSWVIETTKPHRKVMEIPVIIDPKSNEIFYKIKTPFVGRFIFLPGKDLIELLIRKAISGTELT